MGAPARGTQPAHASTHPLYFVPLRSTFNGLPSWGPGGADRFDAVVNTGRSRTAPGPLRGRCFGARKRVQAPWLEETAMHAACIGWPSSLPVHGRFHPEQAPAERRAGALWSLTIDILSTYIIITPSLSMALSRLARGASAARTKPGSPSAMLGLADRGTLNVRPPTEEGERLVLVCL